MDVVDVRDCLHLSVIEQRILNVLADGQSHERKKLLMCIDPKCTNVNALATHIWRIRSKIREFRQDILTEMRRGGICYRQVILLPSCSMSNDTY